ncbi:MAG: hypothetical protein RR747_00495 [Gordonibacter sp.]
MVYDDIVSSMVLELRRDTLVMLVLGQLREPAYGYALVKSLTDHGIPIEAMSLPKERRANGNDLVERYLYAIGAPLAGGAARR